MYYYLQFQRHAVLADRFRDAELGIGISSMMLGNILHECFQEALEDSASGRAITPSYIEAKTITIIENNIEGIITCGSSKKNFLRDARPYYTIISQLIKSLQDASCKVDLKFTNPDNINRTNTEKAQIGLTQILDIEENLWEPSLGLKGKIDVTARCKIKGRLGKNYF